MAIVRELRYQELDSTPAHTETQATYSLVTDHEGGKYLQIDTYGSNARQFEGKKSQSIRLTAEAARQLKCIIEQHFPENSL